MAVLRKSLNTPEETRTFDKGKVELVTVSGVTFGRITLLPGWKWSESVKPVAKTNSCMAPHTQYVLSGKLHVVMDDGTEFDLLPGDACVLPPGHNAWVVGKEPCVAVDVTGLAEYAKPAKATPRKK